MDRDLSFLRQATNDDLEPLVGYILNAELSETLSRSTTSSSNIGRITTNTWT